MEIVEGILTYVSVQLGLTTAIIQQYQKQRSTIINHQQEICNYLNLRPLGEAEIALLNTFSSLTQSYPENCSLLYFISQFPHYTNSA